MKYKARPSIVIFAVVSLILIYMASQLVGSFLFGSEKASATEGHRFVILNDTIKVVVSQIQDTTTEDEMQNRIIRLISGNSIFVSPEQIRLSDEWEWLTRIGPYSSQSKCGDNCYQFNFSSTSNGDRGGTVISFEGILDIHDNEISAIYKDHWSNPGSVGWNVAEISAQVIPV